MKDFFVSYNSADRLWAEWIAWILEEAGYEVVVQAWDFRAGGNFVLDMQRAASESERTIAVLSDHYLNAKYTQPEWVAAFRQDPTGENRTLIPIRVKACEPTGILGPIVYVDVVDRPEAEAQAAILAALTDDRPKPNQKPSFPGQSAQAIARVAAAPVAFPGTGAQWWNVPYSRNPLFTGREELLRSLRDALLETGAVAISGMGGMGKTQTALQYAHCHRTDYEAVFWVRAETQAELSAGFVEIAQVVQLPISQSQDQNLIVPAVKQWLATHENWLLILDYADTLALVREFLPPNRPRHLLLTTRATATGAIARSILLPEMNPQEGALFLLRRTHQIGEHASLEEATERDRHSAETLSTLLDGLPLALDQAAAFIEEKPASIAQYLDLFQRRGDRLLAERGELAIDHPHSVQTTFSLAFQQVEERNPAAADLIRACAFLAPDAIPEFIFTGGATALGDRLAVATDPLDFVDIRAEACRFSLIAYDPSTQTFDIHRLVQAIVLAEMDADARCLWAERVVNAVNAVFPSGNFENWEVCKQLLPHAQEVVKLIQLGQCDSEAAARLLYQTGGYLGEQGQYPKAEPLWQKALELRQRILGDDHLDVSTNLNGLAALYRVQGRYSEAELPCQQALELRQRLLGDDHPTVATSLNNLAVLYEAQGRYNEAEPLLQQALELRQRLLGDDHVDVATSLNNLALLYDSQGRYDKAEPLYIQALELRQRLLGDDHPEVATSLNNLAMLYHSQGRYDEAEPLCQQTLELSQRLLGDDHPDVAASLNNLAGLYDSQGRYDEAEPLYLQALNLLQRLLGDDHPAVATSLNNLASLYDSQGRYNEAEPLHIQALELRQRLLGDDHPDVAESLHNLACMYYVQGRYGEAEPLYIQALEIAEARLGNDHPNTITIRGSLEALRRQLQA